ncbi:MAG: hypothetical protein R3A10_10915 [Caldilineaceae bacterium]
MWRNLGFALILVPLGWAQPGPGNCPALPWPRASTLALYSMYALAPVGINSRFLLPAMPFLAVGAATPSARRGCPWMEWRPAAGGALALLLAWPVPGLARELTARNAQYAPPQARPRAGRGHARRRRSSPTLGDHLAFYGDRSILNYRRIPTSIPTCPAITWRKWSRVSCRLSTVSRPTPRRSTTWKTPSSLWDSLALLQRHFTLTRAATNCRSSRSPRRPRPMPTTRLPCAHACAHPE